MEEKVEFDFCKICKINHKQGRRHNFFPRHTNSLSSLLARFQRKLLGVKSSLKNPSLSLPSNASANRIWCIFCDCDFVEFGSSFTSCNAIKHLTSEDHLKNLKHFLWKYGGGMDKVDTFRITEAEFTKWDKRCKALKSELASSSEKYVGPMLGQSNDIQPNSKIMNSFDNNNILFVDSSDSRDVMPLQYDTCENHRVLHSDISGSDKVGSSTLFSLRSSACPFQHGSVKGNSTCKNFNSQSTILSNDGSFLANGIPSAEVHNGQSLPNWELITKGYQNLSQICCGKLEDVKGNVHSGAPPPWLEGFEADGSNRLTTKTQKNSRKSCKLNPKRVGAAWADRRKLEMEMEKRGDIIDRDSDADWLPNFGRVWQSGTRKESMKEFKKEKAKLMAGSQAQPLLQLHPYISKRMKQVVDEDSSQAIRKGANDSK